MTGYRNVRMLRDFSEVRSYTIAGEQKPSEAKLADVQSSFSSAIWRNVTKTAGLFVSAR